MRFHGVCLRAAEFFLALGGAAVAGVLSGAIGNAGRTALVVDLIQLPATGGAPRARVNLVAPSPDGTGRLFANDLNGPMYVVVGGSASVYLDFRTEFPDLKTAPGLASGFVSFAFHPDFALNGLFYTAHSENVGTTLPNLGPAFSVAIDQHSIVTEWSAVDPNSNIFAGTRRELIRIAAPHRFHNIGELAFNPTARPGDEDFGMLYVGAGDFGSVESGQPTLLQRLDTPLGAILRIDPLGTPFTRGGTLYDYGVPPGNPFASDGDPNTFDEIYAYGVRNSHRLSWDSATGAAYAFDIGQANLEEVNRLLAGANYGWPEREGTFALDVVADPLTVFALPPGDPGLGFTYPAALYDHAEGLAIAGGVIYRGDPTRALYGHMILGDIVNGRIFHTEVDDLHVGSITTPDATTPLFELNLIAAGQPTSLLDIVRAAVANPSLNRVDLRIATDASGEVLISTKQDAFIRRLVFEDAIPILGNAPLAALILGMALVGALACQRAATGSGAGSWVASPRWPRWVRSSRIW